MKKEDLWDRLMDLFEKQEPIILKEVKLEMEDWKERMVEEYKQVRDRVERLRIAVYEQEEGTAQNSERELHIMRKQLDAMETYMCCLMRRAARNGIDLRNV